MLVSWSLVTAPVRELVAVCTGVASAVTLIDSVSEPTSSVTLPRSRMSEPIRLRSLTVTVLNPCTSTLTMYLPGGRPGHLGGVLGHGDDGTRKHAVFVDDRSGESGSSALLGIGSACHDHTEQR